MTQDLVRSLTAVLTAFALFLAPTFADDARSKPAEKPAEIQPDQQQGGADKDQRDQPIAGQRDRRGTRRTGRVRQPSVYQRSHAKVTAAFRDVVSNARVSTVRVLANGKQIALGAIVSDQGHVLTKASQLSGNLQCVLSDGRKLTAKIIGRHLETDLAMLAMEGDSFTAISWRDESTPPVGSFLATSGPAEDPTAIGVVSVEPRKIQAPSGILGVLIEDDSKGARIDQVMPGSAAEQAGLQVNDVIARFNNTKVEGRESLISKVKTLLPGTRVRLSILRGDATLTLKATLGDRDRIDPRAQRGNFQNSLGGELSERRAGFPSVLQHDTVLQPEQCGGPVVDLDGKAVGINIARAGRVESYALPVSVIEPLISQFLAGNFSPDLADRKRIEELNAIIARMQQSESELDQRIAEHQQALKLAEEAEAATQRQVDQSADALLQAQQETAKARRTVDKAMSEKAIAEAELKSLISEKTSLENDLEE